jgi:hypothetical protein
MAEHRDEILRASQDADKTIVNPPRPAAHDAAGGTTLRVPGGAPTAPVVPSSAPESTLRVPPAPPSLAPPASPSAAAAAGPTIRMGDGPPLTGRARPTVPPNASTDSTPATGKRPTPKWPLAVAALLVVGAVIYFAPRFQSTTGVDAQKPATTTSSAAPSTPATTPADTGAASPAASSAPAGAPPAPVSSPAPVPPAAAVGSPPPQPQSPAASGTSPARTQASVPARETAPPQTTSAPPAPVSGPLDAHAVTFATGSDAALATALADALKDKNIVRKASGARWELVVHDQISVRPSGLGSASALTADYVGDLEIRDRSKGTSESRHFDGHALEFGDPVVRAAAVRALAEKMADELAQVIK